MFTDALSHCPICRHIPKDFLKNVSYRFRKIKKGTIVVNQGDPVNFLYLLLRGSVKTEMNSQAGTLLYVETIRAPNPLAPAFLFAVPNCFPVDVIALEDCTILLIEKSELLRLFMSNPTFLESYLSYSSNRTNFLSQRLKTITIKTIKGKLATYILQKSKGDTFAFDLNQTQLSEYFGVTRPSLARSLSEMVAAGVISLNKKNGKILNLNALRELIV